MKGHIVSKILETLFVAADNHGQDEAPDHTIGDLQGLLRRVWSLLTVSQKLELLRSEEVQELSELGSWGEFDPAYLIAEVNVELGMMEKSVVDAGYAIQANQGADTYFWENQSDLSQDFLSREEAINNAYQHFQRKQARAKSTPPKQENSNVNCLEGMACPKCGSEGPFTIHVHESVYGDALVTDDGTEPAKGNRETTWEGYSPCQCTACGLESTVARFKGELEPVFDQFQQVVAKSYNDGDHLCSSPATTKNCGDLLLSFLMAELSEREDCDSFECAVKRLDTAIEQLTAVRSAFEAKMLETA